MKHQLLKVNCITVFLCSVSYSWLREQNCNGFLVVQSNHITIPIVTEMKSQLWYCHKNSWTNKIFRWGMPFTVTWWSKPVQKGQVIFFNSFLIPFSIFMFKGSLSKWFTWFQSFYWVFWHQFIELTLQLESIWIPRIYLSLVNRFNKTVLLMFLYW